MAYVKKGPWQRVCKDCNSTFISNYKNSEYCSNECRSSFYSKVYQKRNQNNKHNLNTGYVGAISEMMVSCELMNNGYEIFRALSPSSSCDLIAIKNGLNIRVEVRTGFYNLSGIPYISFSDRDIGKSDLLACYIKDGTIFYAFTSELENGKKIPRTLEQIEKKIDEAKGIK